MNFVERELSRSSWSSFCTETTSKAGRGQTKAGLEQGYGGNNYYQRVRNQLGRY